MKIWQKHILSQLIKTFLFFLLCLFLVYVIVDLSIHGIRFFSRSDFADVSLYYLYTFSTLLELFLTLAFLLATMRVLFTLNAAREIVALHMAGLSKKRILTPFFFFAGFLSTLCYINSQWVAPDAQSVTGTFKTSHKSKKHKSEPVHVYSSALEDDSELVYQRFDPEKRELFDVFWIKTPQDIWHMKMLQIDPLRGLYVNHLTRNSAKQFEKSASYLTRDFPELPWNEKVELHRFVPLESRSLSTLFTAAWIDSAERPSIFSHLYYKLLLPLLPFLILFAAGPISVRFSKAHPVLLITAASMFGFLALRVIMDGMLIFGENQVLPAALALFSPIALVLALSLPSFARMR